MTYLFQLELVDVVFRVIAIQLVEFDNLYQASGVGWAGGISTGLQSACPSFIICSLQTEQTAVALTAGKEYRMILIALVCTFICTETFAQLSFVAKPWS